MRPNFAMFSPTFSLVDFLIFALGKILEKRLFIFTFYNKGRITTE